MALVRDKKNVGRKGCKRERRNMVKPPVGKVRDIINISPDKDSLPSPKRCVSNKNSKSKKQGSRKNIIIVRKP